MATQFVCGDARRKAAVRFPTDSTGAPVGPTLNGIDYLEVASDQRTLSVHFIHDLTVVPPAPPAPQLKAENVRVQGGVRVTGIRVETVSVAGKVLTVEVDRPGDFSTYRLRLVTSPFDESIPAGFDVQLAEVGFSFKVDCPSDFDCAHKVACPVPSDTAPSIDYLAKDYASFRRLMLERLSLVTPDLVERNPADAAVTLVELLAYVADRLSYSQDAAGTEAYLGTARRRTSVRRHARLIDYVMHDGANARAWVCLDVKKDFKAVGSQPVLPAGTVVLTQVAGGAAIPPAGLASALSEGALAFETVHPVSSLTVKRNKIEFYTWSDARCCLPAGATRATLDGSAADLQLRRGDVLVFEERIGSVSGLPADADPSHRHAVRLDRDPTEVVDRLTGKKVLDVSWYAQDALPFPLCLWDVPDGAGATKRVGVAHANVVLVDHGLTLSGTTERPLITPPSAPIRGRYRPVLDDVGLTHRTPYDHAVAIAQPATKALAVDPRKTEPAVELSGDGDRWLPERDLLETDRFDPKFVVEMEGGHAYIRFGDGVRGRAPAAEASFVATYRIGNGRAGNVGAAAIAHLVLPQTIQAADDICRVWNPMSAQGGTEPEPIDEVRLFAPQAFRTQQRAVTVQDYADVSGQHEEVQRAAATRRWTGSWHTVFVTTDRRRGQGVDKSFAAEIRGFLERFRMAGHDLEIDAPRFVSLDIALTVCVERGHLRANVREALIGRFGTRVLPDGRRGFFHPDNFTFGQPVYLSQIVAEAMKVPGVAWLDVDDSGGKPNRFRRWGQLPQGEIAAGLIPMARLEIARADNDANLPENGRIDFVMTGGL